MTLPIRQAPYALRVVRRRAGMAAILYRRTLDDKGRERLTRVTSISPLAFSAATPLLRAAVRATPSPQQTRAGESSPFAREAEGVDAAARATNTAAAPQSWGAGVAALQPGPFYPLDADWGARVACYARVASGLRNGERLHRAAERLRQADPAEAAWWFGLMQSSANARAVRALRILLEAVA